MDGRLPSDIWGRPSSDIGGRPPSDIGGKSSPDIGGRPSSDKEGSLPSNTGVRLSSREDLFTLLRDLTEQAHWFENPERTGNLNKEEQVFYKYMFSKFRDQCNELYFSCLTISQIEKFSVFPLYSISFSNEAAKLSLLLSFTVPMT